MNETKSKILIVDDEATNHLILKESLKSDYELFFAESGREALEKTYSICPDIILLDVMMPGMSGHEVCSILKSDSKTQGIPIIFISSLSAVYDETTGFSLGAVDYISKPVRPSIVRARIKTHLSLVHMEELKKTQLQIVQRLGYAAEYKDNETGRHVIRMSHYSRILAESLGFSAARVDEIFNAAPMHDIGKIGIPDTILKKNGKLNEDEWQIMKNHPVIGAKIIGEHNDGLLKVAKQIALSHHEKWDGTGYPYGLKKEEINLEARIIAIADVFDALTTARPYKSAWSIHEATSFLNDQAGKHFDPNLISLFLQKLPEVLLVREQWKESA
ncbi:MAG: response regulator [Leptospiraceae bacterium]|nr:response regulator [Leptospiraceae bacterium]